MEENYNCKICRLKTSKLMISLSCCAYLICKEHLDLHIKDKNNIIKCEVCSEELDIQKCFNLRRNKEHIDKFEIESKLKDLEQEIKDYEIIKNDPDNYVYKS